MDLPICPSCGATSHVSGDTVHYACGRVVVENELVAACDNTPDLINEINKTSAGGKTVWCVDATCVAEFETTRQAYEAWEREPDTIKLKFPNGMEVSVPKDDICIMPYDAFMQLLRVY